jgi:hypothetical protein
MRKKSHLMWADPVKRERYIEGLRQRSNAPEHLAYMVEHNKRLWQDAEFRKQHRQRTREQLAKRWQDPNQREKMRAVITARNKQRWADPDWRARTAQAIRIAKQGVLERRRQANSNREVAQRPEERQRRSELLQARWQDPEQAARMIERSRETAKARWQDAGYRRKQRIARRKEAEKSRQRMRERWTDPAYVAKMKAREVTPETRAKISENNKKRWADPAYKARVAKKISASRKAGNQQQTNGASDERDAENRTRQ